MVCGIPRHSSPYAYLTSAVPLTKPAVPAKSNEPRGITVRDWGMRCTSRGTESGPHRERIGRRRRCWSDCLNLFGDQVALKDKCKLEEIWPKQSGGENTESAITKQPLLVASMPANQPPTPVVSTVAPQQQRTYNSGTLVSTNPLNGPSSLAAKVLQNQYKPISAPAMSQRHHQGPHSTNNLKSNANNGNNTRNSNAHNPTKMRPPQPVTRGISPENATGVLSDPLERTLPAVPVQNHVGNNSTIDHGSNKRQKRNQYINK